MSKSFQTPPPISLEHLRPGTRVGVAVSGGADSVAMLRLLADKRQEAGIVLSVLHVHHGLRGADADADAAFVADLAAQLKLRFLRHDVDTPARVHSEQETVEEAARNLRYAWFEDLLAKHEVDAIVTAHTLDDQAETVLQKLLRGAWTEGLSGIFPVIDLPGGRIVRPMLEARKSCIEAWLREIGQPWRDDSSNQDETYTRNRVRRHLLPVLAEYNPRIAEQLGQLADIARDEHAYWQTELARLLPSLLLPGKPVRGGGRSASTHPDEASVAIEVERLRLLPAAARRRVLREAAARIGCALNFSQTALLFDLCEGKAVRREMLTAELQAERTPRELRLVRVARPGEGSSAPGKPPEYSVKIPGEVSAPAFGLHLTLRIKDEEGESPSATLRTPRSGDRVRLRYSLGPKRIKEVLERLRVPAGQRASWPVLEWQGEIVWMRGAEIESAVAEASGLRVEVRNLAEINA